MLEGGGAGSGGLPQLPKGLPGLGSGLPGLGGMGGLPGLGNNPFKGFPGFGKKK